MDIFNPEREQKWHFLDQPPPFIVQLDIERPPRPDFAFWTRPDKTGPDFVCWQGRVQFDNFGSSSPRRDCASQLMCQCRCTSPDLTYSNWTRLDLILHVGKIGVNLDYSNTGVSQCQIWPDLITLYASPGIDLKIILIESIITYWIKSELWMIDF